MRTNPFTLAAMALSLAATTAACSDGGPELEPTMDTMVEQILAPKCTFAACHGAPTLAADLDLTASNACEQLVNKPSCLFPNKLRVAPGLPDESFFLHKLTGDGLHEIPTEGCAGESNLLMPWGASKLDDHEIAAVREWIAGGAQCGTTPKPDPGDDDKPEPPAGPADIATLVASAAAPTAGQTVMFTVNLTKPAPEGGQTIRIDTSSTALSAPVGVYVPAGARSARFDGYAERPAPRFTVTVRTGANAKDAVLRIGGLEVAEVFADPTGADDRLQWVKLRNRSSVPIELSTYRLRAGQANYDLVGLELSGKLAPGACAVVGGPGSTPANGNPELAQVADFSPDLPYGGPQAAGIALFENGAMPVGGKVTPVDTMLVGPGNAAGLLGPDAEVVQPHCKDIGTGSSAVRSGPGACVASAPSPNECP